MTGAEAIVYGAILAFWGLALSCMGLCLPVAFPRRRRRGLSTAGKLGVGLAGLGLVVMLAGFKLMGTASP